MVLQHLVETRFLDYPSSTRNFKFAIFILFGCE